MILLSFPSKSLPIKISSSHFYAIKILFIITCTGLPFFHIFQYVRLAESVPLVFLATPDPKTFNWIVATLDLVKRIDTHP
jgi:hypothetical protein